MGCVLQTKKRYAGYMYETPYQSEPIFDAKGIETVRKDSVPAVSKVRLLVQKPFPKQLDWDSRVAQRFFSRITSSLVKLPG